MALVRITSVDAPLNGPRLLAPAIGLLRRALAVGLLSDREPVERLDLDVIRRIARRASAAGVGQDAALALLEQPASAERLAGLISRLDDALAQSPLPEGELRELLRVYGYDDLTALMGTSAVSLRRYAGGTRAVPDAVANRAHYLALVTSNLAGSYNEFGLRRWWGRPRTQLGGRSPREALAGAWDPESPAARSVAELAASLAGVGSAT